MLGDSSEVPWDLATGGNRATDRDLCLLLSQMNVVTNAVEFLHIPNIREGLIRDLLDALLPRTHE